MKNIFVIIFSPILVILSDLVYALVILPPVLPFYISMHYDNLILQILCGLSAIPIAYVEYKLYKLYVSPSLKKSDTDLHRSNDPKLYENIDQFASSSNESNLVEDQSPSLSFLTRTFRYGSSELSHAQFIFLTLFVIFFIPLIAAIIFINVYPELIYFVIIPGFAVYYWIEKKRVVMKFKFDGNNCYLYDLRNNNLLEVIPLNRIQTRIKKFSYPKDIEVLILERDGIEIGRLGSNDTLNQHSFESITKALSDRNLLR